MMQTLVKLYTPLTCPVYIYDYISRRFSFIPGTTCNSSAPSTENKPTTSLFYTYDSARIITMRASTTTGTPNAEHIDLQAEPEQFQAFDQYFQTKQDTYDTAHITITTNSNVLYYGYRFYNPEMGRWMNRDPIGEHTFFASQAEPAMETDKWQRSILLNVINLYGFVFNDPILNYDMLGLFINAPPEFPNPITSDCVCPAGSNRGRRPKEGHTPSYNGCTGVGPGHFDFTSACNDHDICYDTCNTGQDACDDAFKNNLNAICDQRCGTDKECLFWCVTDARKYYRGVRLLGRIFYNRAQNKACEDCCCL